MCVRKKNNSFEVSSFLRHIISFIISYSKGISEVQTLLPNIVFRLLRDRHKNGEGNKEDVQSVCAKVTKHPSKKVAKAKAKLN